MKAAECRTYTARSAGLHFPFSIFYFPVACAPFGVDFAAGLGYIDLLGENDKKDALNGSYG
jgi:hypothetical protein